MQRTESNMNNAFTSVLSRHRRAVIGATGLAAVLGAGAFMVTGAKTDPARPAAHPAAATRSSAPAAGLSDRAGAGEAAMIVPHALASASAPSLRQRLNDARSANDRLGTGVRRPFPQVTSTADPSKVTVTQTGSPAIGHYLRVSTSRQNLANYQELAWARDGKKFGDATCTQTITLSPDTPPKVKPTLLLCWRTSARKSVYTIAVDFKKPPAKEVSVAALDKAWAKMH
jgi:hypothetical protein